MTKNKELRRRHRVEIHNLCRNVRRLRKNAELPLWKAAKLLKIRVFTLFLLEIGFLPPWLSTETLFCMQELFGVSVMELFL